MCARYFQRNFIAAFSSTRSLPLGQRRAIVIVSFDALAHVFAAKSFRLPPAVSQGDVRPSNLLMVMGSSRTRTPQNIRPNLVRFIERICQSRDVLAP